MLFSSIQFLSFFLPASVVFYYAIPSQKWKNVFLVFASLLFYAWGEFRFAFLMIFSVVLNFNMGIKIAGDSAHRKFWLFVSVAANLFVLFVFKYLGFSCRILNFVLSSFHAKTLKQIDSVLPLGISFYTFQEISYLVDVYKNPLLVQKNIFSVGLYVSFFPQLIAGPIVRFDEIKNQIENRIHSSAKFSAGMERFIIGLSKKVLLANSFALTADKIYGANFFQYGTFLSWVACASYTLQIYYDFSGYSDMAVGLGKMFGFDLPENFNYPYCASSVTDFWKRWHITLTNWFREYLYIPLGGNRKGKTRTTLNRFIVFFTTGLWHGASFDFILWGLLHGFFMTVDKKIPRAKNFFFSAAKRIFTILQISFLWILFRNGTKNFVRDFFKMFGVNYTRFTKNPVPFAENPLLYFYADKKFFILLAAGILFCFPVAKKISQKKFASASVFVAAKFFVLILLLVLCFASLASDSYNPFIYFRF